VHPDKAVDRDEMAFGMDTVVMATVVVTSNIVLEGGPDPYLGSEPPIKVYTANSGQSVTDSGMVTIHSL